MSMDRFHIIVQAIQNLVPDAEYTMTGGISGIVWSDSRAQPTTQQIQTEYDAIIAAERRIYFQQQRQNLRQERNRRLAATDHFGLSDVTMSSTRSAEMTTYRQALRDITNSYTTLDTVVLADEAVAMSEEQKIAVDVVAGTGTAAAFMDMAPNAVAIVTGLWVLIRIWETETVKRLTGRD